MATTLPTADDLLAAINGLETSLFREEESWRLVLHSATNSSATVEANGMIELAALRVRLVNWPPPASEVEAFRASLLAVSASAVSLAVTASKARSASAATGYQLTGVPNQGQQAPGGADFTQASSRLASQMRAYEPSIAGLVFEATCGCATARVNGALQVTELLLERPFPSVVELFQVQVKEAINEALEKAKDLAYPGIRGRLPTGNYPVRPGVVLLVVGTASPLNAADAALQACLAAMGFDVVLKSASSLLSTDVSGKSVVVISETADPTAVGAKLRDVTCPALVMNPSLFDDMGMTGTSSGDAGDAPGESSVEIQLPTHPLAAGLSGTVAVRTVAGSLSWGKPSSEAIVAGRIPGHSDQSTVFGYEKDAAMVGRRAPARRVGWFGNFPSSENLTEDAWKIFKAAIRWLSVPAAIPPIPENQMLLTDACLFSLTGLQIADRAQVKTADGKFATVGNAGTSETNLGCDCQVGNVWSTGPVMLRERCRVNGFVKTASALSQQNNVVITGTVSQNYQIQFPNLNVPVSFPTNNQGPLIVQPDQPGSGTPGAYSTGAVYSRGTLSLSAGTYCFDSLAIEPQAKVFVNSSAGPLVIYVKNDFTYRGLFVETSGGTMKLAIICMGQNIVPLESPFTGTLVVPNGTINIQSSASPGHKGAFYARNITVQPDVVITHDPWTGVPTINT
jgi:hypothetical protein